MTDIPNFRTPAEGVDYLFRVEQEITALEDQLARAKGAKYRLETSVLPELFDNHDEVAVTSSAGVSAKKGLSVTGSLPKVGEKDTPEEAQANLAKREAAIALADTAYGWGPFIKSTVTAAFDKGDRAGALALMEYAQKMNSGQPVTKLEEGIHASTLQAQVRKRIEAGKDVDTEALGITALTAVKLTKRPK